MNIGVLIITRGDRPKFLEHAKYLLSNQILRPDIIEIVDDKPITDKIDITYRYRIGCERLFKKGADCIVFIEDDDFYNENYLYELIKSWYENGKPELFGLNHTIYYNININRYVRLSHPGRASMMSTMISKDATVEWGNDNYAYTDMVLWGKLNGKAVTIDEDIAIGIKHGIGLCGGGGHRNDWQRYDLDDSDKSFLKSTVDKKSFKFYNELQNKNKTV